jgi:hypothetical protein
MRLNNLKHHASQRSFPSVPRAVFAGLITGLLLLSLSTQAELLTWVTTKAQALAAAQSQGKRILLVAGRPGCAECEYMRFTVCESTNPATPVKALIQEAYVPWYCNIDISNEWQPYSGGWSSFSLPMICTVHPTNSSTFIDQSFSYQSPKVFYNRLLTIAAFHLTNAVINNVTVSNGLAVLTMNRLTFGATNHVERSYDLKQADGWVTVADFVSLSRTNRIEDPVDGASESVFYRIKSEQ